jgi:hypothetical protein
LVSAACATGGFAAPFRLHIGAGQRVARLVAGGFCSGRRNSDAGSGQVTARITLGFVGVADHISGQFSAEFGLLLELAPEADGLFARYGITVAEGHGPIGCTADRDRTAAGLRPPLQQLPISSVP